jgi:hypothetical protein
VKKNFIREQKEEPFLQPSEMSKPNNSTMARRYGETWDLSLAANADSMTREQLLRERRSGQLELSHVDEFPAHPEPGAAQSALLRSGAAAVAIFRMPAPPVRPPAAD